jgi:dihydrofolate reductase
MATIYNTATTLDGFLATTDNSLDWLFAVEGADEAESSFPAFLEGVGAMAMGSTTYAWLLEHEALVDEPQKWREWYADRPTWVFTHRDLPVVPGADTARRRRAARHDRHDDRARDAREGSAPAAA